MKNISKLLNAVHRERLAFACKYGYGAGVKLHIYLSYEFENACISESSNAPYNPHFFDPARRELFHAFPYHVVVSKNHKDFEVFSEKPEHVQPVPSYDFNSIEQKLLAEYGLNPEPIPRDGDK